MKNGNGKFSAPEQESAFVGFMATSGFSGLVALPDPSDFTDERWRLPVVAALNVHHSGRLVNFLSINDEITRLGWDKKLDAAIGAAGWQSWSAICDQTISIVPRAARECLSMIRERAAERQAHDVFKRASDGELTLDQTIEKLQDIKEVSEAQSFAALLEPRRFEFVRFAQGVRL